MRCFRKNLIHFGELIPEFLVYLVDLAFSFRVLADERVDVISVSEN